MTAEVHDFWVDEESPQDGTRKVKSPLSNLGEVTHEAWLEAGNRPNRYGASPSEARIYAHSKDIYSDEVNYNCVESLPFFNKLPIEFQHNPDKNGAFVAYCAVLFEHVFDCPRYVQIPPKLIAKGKNKGTYTKLTKKLNPMHCDDAELLENAEGRQGFRNKWTRNPLRVLEGDKPTRKRTKSDVLGKIEKTPAIIAAIWEIWVAPHYYWKFALTAQTLCWEVSDDEVFRSVDKSPKAKRATPATVLESIKTKGAFGFQFSRDSKVAYLRVIKDYKAILAKIFNKDDRFDFADLELKVRARVGSGKFLRPIDDTERAEEDTIIVWFPLGKKPFYIPYNDVAWNDYAIRLKEKEELDEEAREYNLKEDFNL